ncbi:unnamed protein product [Polarella glacialis]|uniref:PDZ domain-containing protein n=1 Tax=Polarella glacialis TaxID=89957 RepID=A0A813JV23_POLGL|nr:unnamed protein product [Polarella glacialis]|mmetsp:Transcript_32446/g.52210  ORF Transcript_32446/g.52210 Transcript_32446/m.52210 type:complete len:138 (-) Transcript_32446:147-560(-)
MFAACCCSDITSPAESDVMIERVPANGAMAKIPQEAADSDVKQEMAPEDVFFRVSLKKTSPQDKLGVHIAGLTDMDAIRIKLIKAGMLETWNQENPNKEVITGDLIVQVNSTVGNSAELQAAIAASDHLDLTILRKL